MQHHLILRILTKLLLPLILLFALYVQFHGDYGPGGGFQAGVIFAAGFILYGLVFDFSKLQAVVSPHVLVVAAATGVLLYGGVGVAGLLLGGQYLEYNVLAHDPQVGQHYGILLIELGVGITVAAVMLIIYNAFSGRR